MLQRITRIVIGLSLFYMGVVFIYFHLDLLTLDQCRYQFFVLIPFMLAVKFFLLFLEYVVKLIKNEKIRGDKS